MELNQNHSGTGDNKITFELKNSPIKIKESFKNSDQVRKFYEKEKTKKNIAIITAVFIFILTPIYKYIFDLIINLIFEK